MILILFLLQSFHFSSWSQVTSLDQSKFKTHTKGAKIHFLATSEILGSKNAFVGFLDLPPHGRVPLHRDETEEYLFVQEGEGTIWIEKKPHTIKANNLVYMKAGALVRFKNGHKRFKALQIFAGPGPEKKYKTKAWK